jgi:hypothetical protein
MGGLSQQNSFGFYRPQADSLATPALWASLAYAHFFVEGQNLQIDLKRTFRFIIVNQSQF